MNPSYGIALERERLRAAGAADAELPTHSEFVVVPRFGHEVPVSGNYRTQNVRYEIEKMDRLGNVLPLTPDDGDHRLALNETFAPDSKRSNVYICPSCESAIPNLLIDTMGVTEGKPHGVIKRFTIDGSPARIYDPSLRKAYDFVRADAKFKSKSGSFTFDYGNDPQR